MPNVAAQQRFMIITLHCRQIILATLWRPVEYYISVDMPASYPEWRMWVVYRKINVIVKPYARHESLGLNYKLPFETHIGEQQFQP